MNVMAYPYVGYEDQPSSDLPTEEELRRLMMMKQEQEAINSWGAPKGGIMNQPNAMQDMQGGLLVNHPQGGGLMGQGEGLGNQEVQVPRTGDGNGGMDVAGFANYGMQAPQLPDPMQGMGNLMKMSQAQNQPTQRQMPQGNLMSYLQQLMGS